MVTLRSNDEHPGEILEKIPEVSKTNFPFECLCRVKGLERCYRDGGPTPPLIFSKEL